MDIQNDNGCGQGLDLDYVFNPYHNYLVALGYQYSHSTRVMHSDGIRRNPHTYKLGKHCVSVNVTTFKLVWMWTTSTGRAIGRHWTSNMVERLRWHLIRKQHRYPECRITCRPVLK